MAVSVANVVAPKPVATGLPWVAPLGTALPTDNITALNVAFKTPGYVDDSGLVVTPTRTTDNKKAFGGDTVKVLQTDFSVTFQFTLLETLNTVSLQQIYGASNVTTTAATSTVGTLQAVKQVSDQLPHQAWVFDMKDGNALVRYCIADGQITDIGAITYSDADVPAYQVTLTAFYNATLGASYALYTNDGVHT